MVLLKQNCSEKIKLKIKAFHKKDKFSILILGRSGAGKSNLINSIFGYKHDIESGTDGGLKRVLDSQTKWQSPLFLMLMKWNLKN